MIDDAGQVLLNHHLTSNCAQEFARKIVRPFAQADEPAIENETKAVHQLLQSGGHSNIISILNHGWLDSPYHYYYLDMELCELSLHQYIHDTRSLPIDSVTMDELNPVFVGKDVPLLTNFLNVWIIMREIAAGVEFLHSQSQVHRDLKPRNGNFPALTLFAPVNGARTP